MSTLKGFLVFCEKLTSESLNIQNCLHDKLFLERIRTRIIWAVMESIPNLSSHFNEHFCNVTKQIVNTFLVLRCKYFTKSTKLELKKSKTRQKCIKYFIHSFLINVLSCRFVLNKFIKDYQTNFSFNHVVRIRGSGLEKLDQDPFKNVFLKNKYFSLWTAFSCMI